jgi:TRAP-type C4-dicarboxylate transport system permease small subunit
MEPEEHVLTASGEFNLHEEAVDLSHYRLEDWIAFVVFWALALVIFYQFFTRYALNDSASWTEEIARYLLIATAFVGAAINTRRNNHIQVDFFYRLLPKWFGRPMSVFVDGARVLFLGYCVGLTLALMGRIGGQRMAIIDWPMGLVYGFVCAGFMLMTWRALDVAVANWRRRASVLEQPELSDDPEAQAFAPGYPQPGRLQELAALVVLGAIGLAVWGAGFAIAWFRNSYAQGIACLLAIVIAHWAFRHFAPPAEAR